jgi:hypothetical protein
MITPGLTSPVVVSVKVYSSVNVSYPAAAGNFPVRLALSNVVRVKLTQRR